MYIYSLVYGQAVNTIFIFSEESFNDMIITMQRPLDGKDKKNV